MTIPTNPIEPFSPFLPTGLEIPQEPERFNGFLLDTLTDHANTINDKKIGQYLQAAEVQNGNAFFFGSRKTVRNGYQAIAHIPSLPNAGVLTLTLTSDPAFPIMNINPEFVITNMWGTASLPNSAVGAGDGDYFTYQNEGNSQISFTMSDTQIVLTSTVDLSAYSGFIIIEYLRLGT